MKNGIFDQVAEFVDMLIVRPLDFAVFSGRNDRPHSLEADLGQDGVGVVATICDQGTSLNPSHQGGSLRAISGGTFCNNNSDRHTMRIHGQMNLGVEPPFVRPMA